jgi:glycosyltransferase involved in cell wall biosynthesis
VTPAPLVSILIPAYNREPYIAACIESARAQTIPDIEIVIVDNCSTDRTWEICQTFARTDPRVRIFRNDSNIGPVRNWARCFAEARGLYGKILFSDDLMNPSYLAATLPWLEDSGIGFVFTAAAVGPSPGEAFARYRWKSRKTAAAQYLGDALTDSGLCVSPGAALFRMQDLRRNLRDQIPSPTIHDFADHGAGPDLLLYLLTASQYSAVAHVPDPLVFFRSHADSISHVKLDRLGDCYSQARIWFAAHHGTRAHLRRALAIAWLAKMKRNRRWISPTAIRQTYLPPDAALPNAATLFCAAAIFCGAGWHPARRLPTAASRRR